MPKLSVFETYQDNKTLEKLIKSLKRDATGYMPGLDIKKDEKIEGKYILEKHRGTITDTTYSIRIINGKIISGQASVEDILRSKNIAFKRYDNINMENPNSQNLELELPEKANLIYNP